MRKRGVFILFLVLISLSIGAQEISISHKVLVPASSVVCSGGYSVSQTIGESAIELIRNERYIFTQGFQQPSAVVDEPRERTGNGVRLYPNPVGKILYLELFGERELEYHVTVFGFNGAIYFKKDYPFDGIFRKVVNIDVGNYQRGTYFVRVVTENGLISRLFKIEKM